jgi:homogentisate 1,2-dioxygenase
LKPQKIGEGSMAFMFESAYLFKFPKFAIEKERLDTEYVDVNIIFLSLFIYFN